MKYLRRAISLCCGLAVGILAGCGTTAEHTTYFAAVNPETKARNYFRVQVYAHTDNGTGCWQTGWYSRKALDEIFSEITTNGSPAADRVVDMHEATFVNLVSNYNSALLVTNFSRAGDYQEAVFRLNGMANLLYSAGATPKDAAENAGKRFVYSFSADPTLLERLISDALESDQVAATLTGLITGNTEIAREWRQVDGQVRRSLAENKALAGQLKQVMDVAGGQVATVGVMNADAKKQAIAQLKLLLQAANH